jgi:hypothetical protein
MMVRTASVPVLTGCHIVPVAERPANDARCRLGEANVEDEVSEPQIQDSAAGPVNDECEQDDDQDHDHQPEEEHDDCGNCVPAYGSGSSHGLQLPGAARIIRTSVIAEPRFLGW